MKDEKTPPAIHLENVRFSWPQTEMQMEFDLTVEPDRIIIVTGPSGSGKSTLLNLIAGFEAAQGGMITIAGRDCTHLPIARRPVSILFQDHNLFAHLTVETNAGFGIAPRRNFNAEDRTRIRKAIAEVGLAGKENRLPHQLSGGERQRAAFARVLLEDRPVLLLDEPFASLGPSLRLEMMQLLAGTQKAKPRTILAVTHHPYEWNGVADGFVFVDEGRIAMKGAIAQLKDSGLPARLSGYLGANR